MIEQVNDVEIELAELKEKVANFESFKRLEKNRDFKRFLKGLTEDKAIDLAKVASQVTLDERSQKVWQNAMITISGVQGHMHGLLVEGQSASEALDQYNAEFGVGVADE